jgi:hypothetical protein
MEELLLSAIECTLYISDVRQTETHTTEPLVPELTYFAVEIAIGKLERYKLPGINQIPAEFIQAGGNTLRSAIHKIINTVLNKEEFPQQWMETIIVPIYEKCGKIDCSNYSGISVLPTT